MSVQSKQRRRSPPRKSGEYGMTRTTYLLIRIGEDGNSTLERYGSDKLQEAFARYVHDRDGLLSGTILAARNGYIEKIAHWEHVKNPG